MGVNKIDVLKKEWKQMAVHLSKEVPEGCIRDKLYDQLSWLKKQMDYYKEVNDYQSVRYCFNEVVDSFNQELRLDKKHSFKKH